MGIGNLEFEISDSSGARRPGLLRERMTIRGNESIYDRSVRFLPWWGRASTGTLLRYLHAFRPCLFNLPEEML